MSEATYTAWDDNLYEWPPPEGWYQADDEKWWPEGYGPAGEDSPGDESNGETPNQALLFEVERTSIFPAGGSGLVGTNQSEELIEAESQRPVYDELPSIDDVFGGADPYADEDEAPSTSNGAKPFSGPPPSIDDLPGLGDIEGVDDSDLGTDVDDVLADVGLTEEVSAEDSLIMTDLDEAQVEGFDIEDVDVEVADIEDVDVEAAAQVDEVDGGLDEDDVSAETNDPVDEDAVDGIDVGAADSEGFLVDDEDGPLDEGVDVADVVDEVTGSDDDADGAASSPGGIDVVERGDDLLADAPTDGTDDDDALHGGDDVDRAAARAALDPADPDEAFDQIVENYDTTEASADDTEADLDLEPDDQSDGVEVADVDVDVDVDHDTDDVEADFDAEAMVSGVHLGELPADLPDPNATALIEPIAESADRPESPLPDVGMHLGSLPETDDGVDFDDDVAPAGAEVGQHRDHADDEAVYGDSPAIAAAQSDEHELSRYRDHTDDEAEAPRRWWPIIAVAVVAAVVAGLVLFLLFGRGTEPGGFDANASLSDPEPGSLGEPYSSGTGVVVFYNDTVTGEERRWVIQVVETVTDQSELLVAEQGAAAPIEGNVLALSRIRVTYQLGPAPGQASDLVLRSIGPSLSFFDQGDACRTSETLDLAASLEPGQAVEGNVCWEVPTADLADLKLAVEAGPVDGIVFMDLN